MSDKTFSFGAQPPSGAAGASPFGSGGQPGSVFGGAGKPSGNLFGGGAASSATSSPSLFPSAPAAAGDQAKPSMFGMTTSGGTGSGLFGSTAGAGGTTSFGFGKPQATPTTAPTNAGGGIFGGSAAGTPTSQPTANPFGGAGTAGGPSIFGASTGTGAADGAKTPAGPKLSFGLASTTPAGPPPASSAGGSGSNLFGATTSQPPSQPSSATATQGFSFGAKPAAAPSSAPSTTPSMFGASGATSKPAPQNIFGGAQGPTPVSGSGLNLFGQKKPEDGAAQGTLGTSQATSNQQQVTAKPLGLSFGAGTSTQQSPGLFLSSAQSAAPASRPANAFGGFASTTQQSSSQPASTAASAAPAFSLGATPKPAGSSSAPTLGLLGSAAQKPAATASSAAAPAATTASSGPNIFGSLASKPAPSISASQGGQASAAPASFGTSAPAPSGGASGAATAGTPATAVPTLGSSTAGPAPPAQSRLKNKSMDEIITRWAADLSKYQKEFQSQAEQVAAWDRTLVENSDKISQLYRKTHQADRDAAEVERQLTAVEGQQEELAQYLDRYEKEVDELVHRLGTGPGEIGGVDQERERTYKLAERLSARLLDLNKDLTDMIDEINAAGAQLSRTASAPGGASRADDPLSQVVRVLNGHLAQLQVIDAGAEELRRKVAAAQREGGRFAAGGSQGLGASGSFGSGGGGGGSMYSSGVMGGSAAEDFYRSYVGRR